jgi:hypothetical protein
VNRHTRSLKRLRGKILVGIVASAFATVGSAAALDKKPNPYEGSGCPIDVPGGTIVYPPGTEITVTLDGEKEAYVCKDGKWVKKTIFARGPLTAASFSYQSVLAVR